VTSTVTSTITFPYQRSLGPVLGQFMTALTHERILGIRSGSRVLCPPSEWDPETGAALAPDLVEVGPAGTVETWCWVPRPTEQHPHDRPFAFATIRLDGADTALVHTVDVPGPEAMAIGLRVAPRWRAERRGHITDIDAFVPGETAVTGGTTGDTGTTGTGDTDSGADEPVTMMEYRASITYETPVPANVARAEQATREGRFLGLRCPTCGRTYDGSRGYCPIDSIELRAEHVVDLPQRGVVANYTIITPVQYPGQTETEPFARVHVLLDGVDVVLAYQDLVDVPNDDVRIGMRVAAVWASEAERAESTDPRMAGGLVGWMPTGEPDVEDPDLVNRIF
jgi:uncharacterized OB-fold protein